jgi:hypothetical protein
MVRRILAQVILIFFTTFLMGSAELAGSKANPPAAVAVPMVVTAEARHGGEIPPISANDVQVFQGKERVQVADWVPLVGDRAGLQLFVLIDDASSPSLGLQFDDLREFMLAQPPTTLVGLGYLRDGTVEIAQEPTVEHAAAAQALRLPLGNGGAFSSIYLSISNVIKRWPPSPMRREILVISDGIDRFGGPGPANPYVDAAIEDAQKAGVIVHAIYASGAGHYSRNFWLANWGQNYLSEIAEETGGESYMLGYQTAVSFAPYLQDLMRHLNHQYLLAFIPKPVKKAGLERVRVKTEIKSVELIAPSRAYIPASAEVQ